MHKKMILASQNFHYGSQTAAWRAEGANKNLYFDSKAIIDSAKWAEKGKFQFVFFTDHPAMREDLTTSRPSATIDPIVLASQIISETEKIGVVVTQSTTFNHPYNVARQLKALDLLSNGRMGWNAVTTSDPMIAANYGETISDRETRYKRAFEFIEIVQGLWGSWEKDALKLDANKGLFAEGSKIQPVNLKGKHLASRGPLPIPPSLQGQPVIFQAGGGEEGLELAGRYASGVYSPVNTIESGKAHRQALSETMQQFGRNPNEISLLIGLFVTVANSYTEALERRKELLELTPHELSQKLNQLSYLINCNIPFHSLNDILPERMLENLHLSLSNKTALKALELLKDGKTPLDVIAHGVVEFHHTIIGTPKQIADQMQEIFESGAADGFSISVDRIHDGLPDFIEKVVPILQKRGLFHTDYEGLTLRDHLGVPYQYGRVRKF